MIYQLLGVWFSGAPWHPTAAFQHHIPLLQQRSETTLVKHGARRQLRRLALCATSPAHDNRSCHPMPPDSSSSGSTVPKWLNLPPSRSAVNPGRSSALGVTESRNRRCGPISLTRSDLLDGLAAAVLGAAATAVTPRCALAATAEGENVVGETKIDSMPAPGGVVEGGEGKYKVASDEVGVLFGDGPIGVKLGENPLKATGVCRVYVTEVLKGSQAMRQADLRAGFGVAAVGGKAAEKLQPQEVAELIRISPRPMEIVFRDPELLAQRLQAEGDKKAKAARRSRRKAAGDAASPETEATNVDARSGSAGGGSDSAAGELRVTQVGKKPAVCGTRTKAGDLIEFRYSARLASDLSVEFDSSDRRGTGLPYAIVLGNGDVLKGLDLSLFDMCVGEKRKIEIPARLAYGRKGSKLFGIPPDDGAGSADVVFGVELVSINFSVNPSDVRTNFYTDDPCDAAAIAAGNASGQCNK